MADNVIPGRFVRTASISVAVTALTVIAGWLLDAPLLVTWVPGATGMKFNAAASFLLAAVALLLFTTEGIAARVAARASTVAVGAIAVATAFEHATGIDAGIDELFVRDRTAPLIAGGRMAVLSVVCFAIVTGLLLFRGRGGRVGAVVRAAGAALVVVASLFVALGFLYGVQAYYSPQTHLVMSLPTAVAFLLLTVGALLADPEQQWVHDVLTADLKGASFFWTVMPAMIGGTAVVGLVRIAAEQAGIIDGRTGVAGFVTANSIIMSALAVWMARRLNVDDRVRRSNEAALRAAHDGLDAAVKERTRELLGERDFISAVLDTAGAIIVVLDPELRLVRFNKTAERLTGYPADEVQGRRFEFLLTDDERETVLNVGRELVLQRTPSTYENHWKTRSGGLVRIEWSNIPICDAAGEPSFLVCCGIDVTDERAAQDEAARQREELEAFAYSVSHDLRAPLRSIEGFSTALVDDCSAQLDPDGLDYLRRIRGATTRMAELIDGLLGLSRVSRAEMASERVELAAMADEMVATLRSQSPGRAVKVTIARPLDVHGDSRLLGVVMQNLLDNAWKFTGQTSLPEIEVGRARDGAIFVRDNGAGFEMEFAGKLFAPFQRLHSTRDFAGTGVGLATVRRIIRRHGGDILAVAAPGHGATFSFTLPPSMNPLPERTADEACIAG